MLETPRVVPESCQHDLDKARGLEVSANENCMFITVAGSRKYLGTGCRRLKYFEDSKGSRMAIKKKESKAKLTNG